MRRIILLTLLVVLCAAPASAIFKDTSGQQVDVFVWDLSAEAPLTTDSLNITAWISLDSAASVALTDTNPSEKDATKHPGVYVFDLLTTETSANLLTITAVSTTANTRIASLSIYTRTVMRGTDSALLAASVNVAAGVMDANIVQVDDQAVAVATEINANVTKWQGSDVTTPTVAGIPNVDVVRFSGDASTDLTTSFSLIANDVDRNAFLIESQRGFHTGQSEAFWVDPFNGDTHANGNRGGLDDPYATLQDCIDNAVSSNRHDVVFMVAGNPSGPTVHSISGTTTIDKNYVFIRGPGRDFIFTRTGAGDTIAITGNGIEISGMQIGGAATGAGDGIDISDADFHRIHQCWFLDIQGDGIHILRGENTQIHDNHFKGTGVGGSGQGIHIVGTAGASSDNVIHNNHFADTGGDSIFIEQGTTNDTEIHHNTVHNSGGWGINIGGSSTDAQVYSNLLGNNTSGDIQDNGTDSIIQNNYDVSTGVWDELVTAPEHNIVNSAGRTLRELKEQIVYLGVIWINTTGGGTSGAEQGENGTIENPVDNITDALTLSGLTGIKRFHVSSASSITLVAALENIEIFNSNWDLFLGGQSISKSCVSGADVSGIATGVNPPKFINCHFTTTTLPPSHFQWCGFSDTFTAGSAGTFYFDSAHSAVAGTDTPVFDFGSGLDASNVNYRHFSGGIEVRNMGAGSGSYNMSLEGDGQLIIDSSCSADSTIAIRGHFTVAGNVGGAVILSDNARYDTAQINEQADLALSDYDGPTNAELEARTLVAADYFDSAADTVTVGAVNAGGAADFFTVDSGETSATAVSGSVVKEMAVLSTDDLLGRTIMIDGTTTVEDIFKVLYSKGVLNFNKATNTYTGYDTDGTTVLYSFTIDATDRMVVP